METTKLIISLFGVYISASLFNLAIYKYVFGKQFDAVYAAIKTNEDNNIREHERIDHQHSECSKQCATCRSNCAIERKKDIERIYDKMKV